MFGSYPKAKVKLNKFKYFPEKNLTCNMGYHVPIFAEEVLPGDFWKLRGKMLVRLQSLIAPIYHRINVFTRFYFVPYRLLWNNWEQFITGWNLETNEPSNAVLPSVKSPSGGWQTSSLMDYLGFATDVTNYTSESGALFPRAYNQIINDWLRNENVTEPYAISLDDGLDTTTNLELVKANWEKDIFTSALPWAQRGPIVNMPWASNNLPVYGTGYALGMTTNGTNTQFLTGSINEGNATTRYASTNGLGDAYSGNFPNKAIGVTTDSTKSGLVADASGIDVPVADVERAFALQRFARISARAGARYAEYLIGHFGVRSSDARLQRAEYLGGSVAPLDISAVVQTSSTDATTPQGNLAGLGISASSFATFKKRFTEHGVIIGLLTIMPRTSYNQGNRRMFNRTTLYDYAVPSLSRLGEREILEEELYAQPDGASTTVGGTSISNKTGFGFAPQYEEYRYIPSTNHGDFKSTLDFWTMARKFNNPPVLGKDFVESSPTKDIFAVTDEQYDSCLCSISYDITAYRPLPKYGIPIGAM